MLVNTQKGLWHTHNNLNNPFMANTQKGSVNPYRGGCLPHNRLPWTLTAVKHTVQVRAVRKPYLSLNTPIKKDS